MADLADRLYERLLVLRCQTGEETAFGEVIERYGPRLRYYLGRIVERSEQVDDVLQEVWLTAFRTVSRLRDPEAFNAWLYRIAHNKASLELRKRCREKVAGERELAECAAEGGDFSAEDAEQIHVGLAKLAVEYREVLVLRFLEGMSYDEIAEIIDCPVGTVASRVHYAKCALRREIERMNHGD
jgi:RNA polymerase sigma-70 factor, ECF subfamily